ncbi:MAG: hypothetical protein QOH78_1163 [Verrucomicrobiota bacterium]
MYALTIATQKKRLERLGPGFFLLWTLSRSKAGRLTYCRQAVPACFGEYRGKLATHALTVRSPEEVYPHPRFQENVGAIYRSHGKTPLVT